MTNPVTKTFLADDWYLTTYEKSGPDLVHGGTVILETMDDGSVQAFTGKHEYKIPPVVFDEFCEAREVYLLANT